MISVIAVVLLANLTPLSYLWREDYTYRNYDGSFRFNEEGSAGFNFKMARTRYRWFLKDHPEKQRDTLLYRTFTIKPWRFWQWGDFVFGPDRFKLPYKKP